MSRLTDPIRILQEFQNAGIIPDEPGQTLKQHMLQEIIMRCLTDAAGHIQLLPQSRSEPSLPRVTMGGIMEGINKVLPDLTPMQRMDLLLGVASTYTKGIVQTPHPTEMLSREAIEEEKILTEALESSGRDLFTQRKSFANLSYADRGIITDAIKHLYDKISPVEKPLSVAEEMARSVVFSQNMFDAVPMIAERILKAGDISSDKMSDNQLSMMFHLIQPETWSPGDRDSKPDMTAEELENGMRLNRRAMMKHYAKHLLTVIDHARGSNIDLHDPSHCKAFDILERLLKTAQENEDVRRGVNYSKQPLLKYASTQINQLGNGSTSHSEKMLLDYMESDGKGKHAEPRPYQTKEELLKDLFEVRASGQFQTYAKGAVLTELDTLIIQAGNFGLTALRSQVRQNRDVHERVFKHLAELVGGTTGEDMLAQVSTSEKARLHIHDQVMGELAFLEKQKECTSRLEAEAAGKLDDFYFYQTLKGMEIAARNPDLIPHYLIAECASAEDIYKVAAMFKIMQPPPGQCKGTVEVVPLVEHPDQVMEINGKIPYVEMMKEAMSNKHFRAYQDQVSDAQYDFLLKDAHIGRRGPQIQPLTVADVMSQSNAEYRLKDHPEDAKKIIRTAKLCMGAGSDVTKAGGIPAAALMQNAMQRLREELLTLKDPVLLVDYIGCGGGVHRSNPVSTAFRTAQGRSMRQTPDTIATEATALLARHMRDRLATDQEWEGPPGSFYRMMTQVDRRQLAALNLGNMANLPHNPAVWKSSSRDIVEEATRSYMAFANGKNPEYAALLKHSADVFAKLTSYAARPTNRVSAAATAETFPAEVQMEKLRAIGYGAALNASGSCASLYCGVASIADKLTYEGYLYDPKVQDMVNRATYGIIMSDLDTAWRYLGEAATPDADKLKTLATETTSSTDSLTLAKRAMAKVTLEHDRVGEALVTLLSKAQHKPLPNRKLPLHERLIALLPEPLAAQMEYSRENITLPRRALAELFRKFQENNGRKEYASHPDKTLPPEVQEVIAHVTDKIPHRNGEDRPMTQYHTEIVYPAMAAIMECFEHAPRAYTSPNWALGQAKALQGKNPGVIL